MGGFGKILVIIMELEQGHLIGKKINMIFVLESGKKEGDEVKIIKTEPEDIFYQ